MGGIPRQRRPAAERWQGPVEVVMRADRLLSILMLLQSRGRLTARELAQELEVSERTIYRDVEALCVAGVPVCSERGPGGGMELLGGYRTNLTGLSDLELRALFAVSVPHPLNDLGLTDELRGALRKLIAALPPARQMEEERMRRCLLLDGTPWDRPAGAVDGPTPHLHSIQGAAWEDRMVRLRYSLYFGAEAEQVLAPYGLVWKEGAWYVVAARDRELCAIPVARVLAVEVLEERFQRREGFDLAAYWRAWCAHDARANRLFVARVRISPELAEDLPRYVGRVANAGLSAAQPDRRGWRTVDLPFASFEEARSRLLGLGGAAEVLAPEALRRSVADFARQIVLRYDA